MTTKLTNHQIIVYFLIILVFLSFSCDTYRTIIPTINGSVRQDFKLQRPIIVSFKDGRQTTENSQQLIESLQNGLKNIYGNNIIFKSYFDKTENENVAIKIIIKEIGSKFGIRSFEYQTYNNQITSVSASVSTYWGSAVSTAIISQPVLQNNISVQGYWVGTSYLEITLVDNLHAEKKIYEFPFIGEDTKDNTFGYGSAKKAAQNSWNKGCSSRTGPKVN